MDCKHTWDRPKIIALPTFQAIVADFARLLPELESRGVLLRHGWDQAPYLEEDRVAFEGRWPGSRERRKQNPFLGDRFQGNGSCQSFEFLRVDRFRGGECKTNRYNYDLAVTCFLLIAGRYLGPELMIGSEAEESWWEVPRALCQELLGYGREVRIAQVVAS